MFIFGRGDGSLLLCAAALMLDQDMMQLYVFNIEAGHSANDAAIARDCVGADHVADKDAPQRSGVGGTGGAAQAAAEAQENGSGRDVAHGDVGDGYILEQRSVYCFQRQPLAAL